MTHEIQSNTVRQNPQGDYGKMCEQRALAYKLDIYALPHSIPNGRGEEMMRRAFINQRGHSGESL